jgi:hypothetical protein
LRQFAGHCDAKGRILYYNCYEQHNLLENASHWVDSPWRPVNCLQDTELPHKIPVGRLFYDTSHPLRTKLQKLYLTKVLDELGEFGSMLCFPSKEYTGPLPWIATWVDMIVEWEKKNNQQVHIGLMCTKDVVDAILEDPIRGPAISVIDMRMWWYLKDATLYAPQADKDMAPRQYKQRYINARNKNLFHQTPEHVYRKVREYRERYPDKAVISDGLEAGPWPVLMAGGSMYGGDLRTAAEVHLFELIDKHLSDRLQRTAPTDLVKNNPERNWCLADHDRMVLAYASAGGPLVLDLVDMKGKFRARWFDPADGRIEKFGDGTVTGGAEVTFKSPVGTKAWLLWLERIGE